MTSTLQINQICIFYSIKIVTFQIEILELAIDRTYNDIYPSKNQNFIFIIFDKPYSVPNSNPPPPLIELGKLKLISFGPLLDSPPLPLVIECDHLEYPPPTPFWSRTLWSVSAPLDSPSPLCDQL